MMSIVRKLFGFCCCGDPPVDCDVCEDDFARSDGTDISTGSACGWTETTGDPTITSGRVRFTTTSAKATCNTNSPNAARSIQCVVRASNNNNLARVYVGDWIVQVQFGFPGHLRIINSGGSTAATQSANAFTGSNMLLYICYDGTTIAAELVIGTTTTGYVEAAASISDLTNGLGTGGTVTGNVEFDDFILRDYSEDCECRRCAAACQEGTFRQQYKVVLSGTATGTCASAVNSVVGTYYPEWDGYRSGWPVSGCYWTAPMANTIRHCFGTPCGCYSGTGDPMLYLVRSGTNWIVILGWLEGALFGGLYAATYHENFVGEPDVSDCSVTRVLSHDNDFDYLDSAADCGTGHIGGGLTATISVV